MQNKTILTAIILLLSLSLSAQQIPVGSCGIANIYDAAGNRTKRTYFCNNGTNPYPQRSAGQQVATAELVKEITEFQEVNALYPNPTTGRFSVSFSKALDRATIHILDEAGKIIVRVNAMGYRVDFDLSSNAAGIYFVRIEENGKIITQKVVKK